MEKQWRMAAEKHALEYRKLKAYVQGVEDAAAAEQGCDGAGLPLGERAATADEPNGQGRGQSARPHRLEDAPAGAAMETYRKAKRWIWAVEAVEKLLLERHAYKHAFFVTYYGLHKPRFGHTDRAILFRLCDQLHASRSTLYAWKREIQTLLVLAAVQQGALRPYGEAEKTGAEGKKNGANTTSSAP